MNQKNEPSLLENILVFSICLAIVCLLYDACILPLNSLAATEIDQHFPAVSQYLKS